MKIILYNWDLRENYLEILYLTPIPRSFFLLLSERKLTKIYLKVYYHSEKSVLTFFKKYINFLGKVY